MQYNRHAAYVALGQDSDVLRFDVIPCTFSCDLCVDSIEGGRLIEEGNSFTGHRWCVARVNRLCAKYTLFRCV